MLHNVADRQGLFVRFAMRKTISSSENRCHRAWHEVSTYEVDTKYGCGSKTRCGAVEMEDAALIKVRKIALLRLALNPAHRYRNLRACAG